MAIQLKRHFVLRKLHQLTGIVPLGLFMMEHFYSNWVAVHGAKEFNEGVEWLHAVQSKHTAGVGPGQAPV